MQCFFEQTNNENETTKKCNKIFVINFFLLLFLFASRSCGCFFALDCKMVIELIKSKYLYSMALKYQSLFICVCFSIFKINPIFNQQLEFHCRQIWSIYNQFSLRFKSKLKVCGLEIEIKCNWLNQHSMMVNKFERKIDGNIRRVISIEY